jgi:hypothetical protein
LEVLCAKRNKLLGDRGDKVKDFQNLRPFERRYEKIVLEREDGKYLFPGDRAAGQFCPNAPPVMEGEVYVLTVKLPLCYEGSAPIPPPQAVLLLSRATLSTSASLS